MSLDLDFAELQAKIRKAMYMPDWIRKLDDFLRLSERDVLSHAGQVSHHDALAKAQDKYEQFRKQQANLPSPVERHFDEAVRAAKAQERDAATPERSATTPRKRTKKPAPKHTQTKRKRSRE